MIAALLLAAALGGQPPAHEPPPATESHQEPVATEPAAEGHGATAPEAAGQEAAGHEATGHEPAGHEAAGHEAAGHEAEGHEGPAAILMHHVTDARYGHLMLGPLDVGPTKHLAFFVLAAAVVLVIVRLAIRSKVATAAGDGICGSSRKKSNERVRGWGRERRSRPHAGAGVTTRA